MDEYGYIGIETLLDFCEKSKDHAVTPNDFMRMPRVNLFTIEPEPHWIPVTERLPEYGTQVLAIHKDGDYEVNHVIDEEDGEWFLNGVIAWMSLPEPYREEGE